MGEAIYVLSPHFDDAVLQAYAYLEHGNVSVITVFGGSPPAGELSRWDMAAGFTTAAEAHHARQRENAHALRHLGCAAIDLDYVDYPYRTASREADLAALPEHLETIIAPADALIIAAAGLGRRAKHEAHPDHVAVRNIGKTLLASYGRDVVFSADIPYVLPRGRPAKAWPKRLRYDDVARTLDLAVDVEPHYLTPEQRHAKRQALQMYASQYGPLTQGLWAPLRWDTAYRWELIYRPTVAHR